MESNQTESSTKLTRPESSLILSEAERAEFLAQNGKLILAVGEINKLVAYPLDKFQLVDWAIDIVHLTPGVEPSRLVFLFDCYKTERLVWDNTKGIQNVFLGLRMIALEEGKYILRKVIQ